MRNGAGILDATDEENLLLEAIMDNDRLPRLIRRHRAKARHYRVQRDKNREELRDLAKRAQKEILSAIECEPNQIVCYDKKTDRVLCSARCSPSSRISAVEKRLDINCNDLFIVRQGDAGICFQAAMWNLVLRTEIRPAIMATGAGNLKQFMRETVERYGKPLVRYDIGMVLQNLHSSVDCPDIPLARTMYRFLTYIFFETSIREFHQEAGWADFALLSILSEAGLPWVYKEKVYPAEGFGAVPVYNPERRWAIFVFTKNGTEVHVEAVNC